MSAETVEHQNVDHTPVLIKNRFGKSPVLLVCEHASNYVPGELENLGLDEQALQSHVAWDPGAMAIAERLSDILDAKLIASQVSRLVIDCNRPPDAEDAMPARSELFDIPGNADLSKAERRRRAERYYAPFRDQLADMIAGTTGPLALVTIHSFTPIFMGKKRHVELGILHDADARLADEMLRLAPVHCKMAARRNEPYGPDDGVTHTLKAHALEKDLINVMLEIRNDLIKEESAQDEVAQRLSELLRDALENLKIMASGGVHS